MMSEGRDTVASFAATRWTLVHQLQGGGEDAASALEALCAAYWYPLYGWARRSGSSPADAEDAVQGFFSNVIRKRLFERADLAKGRLRTLLLTAFRRYQRDLRAKGAALQRGGGRVMLFDATAGEEWYQAELGVTAAPDALYDRQWAIAALQITMQHLAEEYDRRGKAREFEQLRRYLTDDAAAEYEADAEVLGISAGAVKVAVHRLRGRFREALRKEVASMQNPSEDVDEELGYLLRALVTTE